MPENVCNEFISDLFFSGAVAVPAILLDYYAKMGLTAEEMMFLIHVIQTGAWRGGYDGELIREKMGISRPAFDRVIRALEEKLVLKTGGTRREANLDFSGLLEQLFERWGITIYNEKKSAARKPANGNSRPDPKLAQSEKSFIELYEKERGRPLSEIECDLVRSWLLDGHSEEMLHLVLRKGVEMGKLVPKYLDSILREWEKKGLRTVAEVEAEDERFRQSKGGGGKKRTRRKQVKKDTLYDDIYLN
ncbi:MAG: DnaD domain protein [Gracilibacteraceae bacterium]|jgi:DNA replication protein|nr:DnaD domain protein [Gracilibacteraceae bacterium]